MGLVGGEPLMADSGALIGENSPLFVRVGQRLVSI
jgi:hypothetical protein